MVPDRTTNRVSKMNDNGISNSSSNLIVPAYARMSKSENNLSDLNESFERMSSLFGQNSFENLEVENGGEIESQRLDRGCGRQLKNSFWPHVCPNSRPSVCVDETCCRDLSSSRQSNCSESSTTTTKTREMIKKLYHVKTRNRLNILSSGQTQHQCDQMME